MNSRDYNPVQAGTMLMLISPPKVGKSYMARSAARLGKTFAFLAPSAEAASYAGCDMEYEVLVDLLAAEREAVRADGRSTEGLNWQKALDSDMLELIKNGHVADARERLQACLSSSSD